MLLPLLALGHLAVELPLPEILYTFGSPGVQIFPHCLFSCNFLLGVLLIESSKPLRVLIMRQTLGLQPGYRIDFLPSSRFFDISFSVVILLCLLHNACKHGGVAQW